MRYGMIEVMLNKWLRTKPRVSKTDIAALVPSGKKNNDPLYVLYQNTIDSLKKSINGA